MSKKNEMSNSMVLRRILSFIKVNSLWTIVTAVAALIGVPIAIWAIKDHGKKPAVGISISGYTIPEGTSCNIYYLIPQEYYDGPMNGTLLFELSNSGTAELTNVYAMLNTESVYDSRETSIISSGSAKTVEQQDLRFRRLVEQEYYDDIAGEKISVSYRGFSECMTFVCRNLPKGMLKCIQPDFVIDRDFAKEMESKSADNGLGELDGGQVYDAFKMDITYAATNVPTKINHFPILVVEEVSIDDIVRNYEEKGVISSATCFNQYDIANGYVNNILIYPKYVVENNVINVNIEDAQAYHVKYDTFFKEKRSRIITIRDLNKGKEVSYEFKDTPERKAIIKRYYDTISKGYSLSK